MDMYLLATAALPAPQSIPAGFGGQFDWSVISDEEKARRAWVRFDPPSFDPVYERVETNSAESEDGVWRASYAIVPGPIEFALEAAKATIAARRWDEQTKGVTVEIGGAPHRFLSTKEGQGDIGNALQLAQASEAANGPGTFSTSWKALDGFVTISAGDLMTIGFAIGAHVMACYKREEVIVAALAEAAAADGATAYSVRNTLSAEIDQGWSG